MEQTIAPPQQNQQPVTQEVISEIQKPIVLTPAIANLINLITELRQIKNGTHESIERQKKEKEKDLEIRLKRLDNYEKYQTNFIRKQYECEAQQSRDEHEDFISTFGV